MRIKFYAFMALLLFSSSIYSAPDDEPSESGVITHIVDTEDGLKITVNVSDPKALERLGGLRISIGGASDGVAPGRSFFKRWDSPADRSEVELSMQSNNISPEVKWVLKGTFYLGGTLILADVVCNNGENISNILKWTSEQKLAKNIGTSISVILLLDRVIADFYSGKKAVSGYRRSFGNDFD